MTNLGRPEARQSTIDRLREQGSEAAGFLFMTAFRGVGAFMAWKEQRQELRLLKQGITDDPFDWKHHRERGTSLERRTAFKKLYDTLEQRTRDLSRYERVTSIVDPVLDERRNDQLFPVLRTDRFDGTYSVFFLFDSQPDSTDGLVAIQKHDNEKYGATYTVTRLSRTLNPDGSRDGTTFAVGRDNWDAGSPWIDANRIVRHGDKLDDALLNGDLLFFKNSLLMTAESQEQVEGSQMSAAAAEAICELVPQWTPVTRAQDAW